MNLRTILELSNYVEPKRLFKIRDLIELEAWSKYIERKIRSDIRYEYWRHNIKYINKEQTCKILGIDTSELQYSKIEYHHVIYLWYLVMISGKYLLNNLPEGEVDIYISDIVNLVMEDHLDNIIPYIPLTTTYHQLVHDELKKFKLEDISGNYEEYLEKYKKEINEIDVVKIHIDNIFI